MPCTWASSFRDYETIVLSMSRSISPPAQGRTGQKARTRAAMIEAARTLLAAGTTPTVEAAAAHAGVGRRGLHRRRRARREQRAGSLDHRGAGACLLAGPALGRR